ncbi:MAG TPA: lipoyl(octanoyl) transferase LipB [Egibacteraceae bacterium]|jgi:lipoyl(octanoyl) transferase|nr:lipoyl(octanoyl) transferase LipB [Egibacteraceae bacterium]
MLAVDCGRLTYADGLRWQRALVSARRADAVDDVLLSCEHEPVYTAGRHADVAAHVLGTRPIPVVAVDRGGDVTYHGPGQLVVYPIVRLRARRAVRAYVEALEEACVRTAAAYGIVARPDRRRTGVWVGGEKLAAIGIRVEDGVTSHGLAFNVTTDLDDFAGIVPCGIRDAGVCSLASLGVATTVADVGPRLLVELARALDRDLRFASPDEVGMTPRVRR